MAATPQKKTSSARMLDREGYAARNCEAPQARFKLWCRLWLPAQGRPFKARGTVSLTVSPILALPYDLCAFQAATSKRRRSETWQENQNEGNPTTGSLHVFGIAGKGSTPHTSHTEFSVYAVGNANHLRPQLAPDWCYRLGFACSGCTLLTP